uniref:Uncharacterized protein n=1 Tax=Cannabis sativa TaxID=3483 RepID=A0A803Q846_CANSA
MMVPPDEAILRGRINGNLKYHIYLILRVEQRLVGLKSRKVEAFFFFGIKTRIVSLTGEISEWLLRTSRDSEGILVSRFRWNRKIVTSHEIFATFVVSMVKHTTKIVAILQTLILKVKPFSFSNLPEMDVHSTSERLGDIKENSNPEIGSKAFKQGEGLDLNEVPKLTSHEIGQLGAFDQRVL